MLICTQIHVKSTLANRGRPSNRRTDEKGKRQVLKIYQQEYAGFEPTLAAEKLHERDQITLSDETLRLWLRQTQVAYPIAHYSHARRAW